MMNTYNWSSDWPDWADAGRRVAVMDENGGITEGILEVADQFFDGESEVPIFSVKLDDSTSLDFASANAWCFVM